MDIDAGLCIVPTATTTIHKSTCLGTTIIRVLGIEDIVDLTQQANIRRIVLFAPLLHR